MYDRPGAGPEPSGVLSAPSPSPGPACRLTPSRARRRGCTNGRAAAAPDDLRPVRMTRHYTRHAEGSVLVEFGETRVICTASVEKRVPRFLLGSGSGWVTAEYGMLPPLDERAYGPRGRSRAPGRPGRWKFSGLSAGASGRSSISKPSANVPSTSTATSSRRTAEPAPRRSPAPTSRSRTRLRPCALPEGASRFTGRSRRSRSGSGRASRSSTSTTPRTGRPRRT